MAISKDFIDAVEQKKVTRVRIMMKDNLLIDTSFKNFDEMLEYAQKSIPELVVEHDGEAPKPQSDWDEDYLNDQMVAVVNNFSEERIQLLKRMVNKLYGKKENPSSQNTSDYRTADSSYTKASERGMNTKILGGCIAGAGAVALIVGIAVANMPVVVPVIGGAAMGVGAYLILKKN